MAAHIAEYMRHSPDIETEPSGTDVQWALDDLRNELHNGQQMPDGRYYRS